MDLPFDCGLSTGSTNFVPTPGEYHCQSFWHNSLDTQQQCTTSPESQPLEHADCHSGSQRYSGLYLGPLRPSVRSFESDSSNTFVDDTVEESDEPFSEDEACYCRRDDYYGYSSDSDYDDSSVIDDQCSTDSPSPENSVPLEPYLGPFGPTKETNNLRNWAQAFQQRFGSISGVSNNAGTGDTVRQNPPVSTTSTRLMTDYLAHYVEHDHPRLARILPGLFPSLPAECFDQIQTSRVCSRTSQSTGGQGPPGHAVLNIFQSLQQSHKNVQNLERAHATRIRVERDLLHHSPQRIRTLSLSAARVHAITLPPVHPRQTSPVKARSRSSIVSPLPSLLSLLPSSLFSKSPVTPVSSGSSWHSSESSSTVFSYRSYHSTASSSFSAESLSWTNVPPLSKLGRLYRIELHDIYHGIDIDAVVDFLELHDKTFHTIREIKVGGADDLGRASDPRVIMILRCLRTVKALDMVEWREAIKFMDRIPTKHLETLLLGNVRMTNVESGGTSTSASNDSTDEQVHPQIRTLQRCRLLREVRMPVLIERLFEWAVKERQERLLLRPLPTALFSLDLGSRSSLVKQKDQPYWDNDRDRRRPVQLENVHLSGTSTGPLISTLLHIVDAFRDSLQVLQSTSWLDSTEAPFSCQNLSWSWCLPQLQILELQGEIAYRLRIQTLQNCPQLRVLRLSLPHSVLPSSPVRPTLATESQPHSPCQRCQCVSQLPTISLADYFCPKDDYTEAKRTAPICPHKLDIEEHRWHPGKRQEQPHNKPALFPRLQELKLAGDWGLQDESLLRMAETMPQLTRLSLLRCESDTLTARGLILALPSLLRRNQNQGQNPSHNGNRRECRLQWLEVSKTWQSELDAAMADRENYGVLNDAIDKRGTWPLQVLYQY
ncbi:hypothetical protein EDD11_009381 [Mortierella claussenii]|nr:hypothetical protein EDD11_009381 [Mortierella claussenii]